MRERFSSVGRGWSLFLALVLLLALIPGSFFGGGVSPARGLTRADFSVTVKNGPTIAVRRTTFSFTVEVSSIGPDSVTGATILVSQPSATNLAVPTDCVTTGDAVCPADWAISGSTLTGTFGAFSVNAKATFTFSGKFTGFTQQASVSTTATVTVPAGVTDSTPDTNTSFQATTFVIPRVSMEKSAFLASAPNTPLGYGQQVPLNSEFLWRIKVTNTGLVPLTGGRLRDEYSIISGFVVTNIAGSLTCNMNGVDCASSITLNPTGDPFDDTAVPDIPLNGVLTVTFRSVVTKTTCGKDSFRNLSHYRATGLVPDGYGFAPPLDMDGGACPPPPIMEKSVALASAPGTPLANNILLPSGSEFLWTIKVTNPGSVPFTGGKLKDRYASLDYGFVAQNVAGSLTCKVNGVDCIPSITLNPTGDPFDYTAVPDIPPNGVLTVTFRSSITKTTCGEESLSNQALYDPARPSLANSVGSIFFRMNPGDCPPPPSVSLVKSVALASAPGTPLADNILLPSGSEFLWTIKVTNTGPVPLTGGKLEDFYSGFGNFAAENVVGSLTCNINGADCASSITLNPTDSYPFRDSSMPNIPINGVLTVTFRSKVTKPTCGKEDFDNYARYMATGTGRGSHSTNIYMSAFDLGVSVLPSAQVVAPGGDFWLDLSLQNGCAAVPADTRLSWVLPSAQDFVFPGVTPASVQCTAPDGKTCPSFSFNPTTRILTANFVGVEQASFKVRVLGKAGTVLGVSSPTTATLLSATGAPLGDINPASDSARVTYDIRRQRITNYVRYNIVASGLTGPLYGIPADIAVTGKMVCTDQGEFPWNLTIAAGESSAAWQQEIWSQDTCHFEIAGTSAATNPENLVVLPAPAGWRWATTPGLVVTSTDKGLSAAQDGNREIVVTGWLEPITVPLAIEKLGVNCDVNTPTCPLPGSGFAIFSTDPALSDDPTLIGTLTPDSAAAPVGYRFLVSGLPPGDYWLVEYRAAPGFALLAQPVQFRLAVDGTITLLSPDTAIVTIRPGTTTPITPTTLVVHDQPVVNLPRAGGPGIWWLALAGALLLATGLTLHRTTRHQP